MQLSTLNIYLTNPIILKSVQLKCALKQSVFPKSIVLRRLQSFFFFFVFIDDIENEESLFDVSRTSIPELSLDKTPMDQMIATVNALSF